MFVSHLGMFSRSALRAFGEAFIDSGSEEVPPAAQAMCLYSHIFFSRQSKEVDEI